MVTPINLLNIAQVPDSALLMLKGVSSLATVNVAGKPYLIAAGAIDRGVSVFEIGADGLLTNVSNVGGGISLNNFRTALPADIDGKMFVFVSDFQDSNVSVYEIGAGGILTLTDQVTQGDTPSLLLNGARGLAIVQVGVASFLVAAGSNSSGISVFRVASDGTLTNTDNQVDTVDLLLAQATVLATVQLGSASYIYAGGYLDSGISIFEIDASGTLSSIANVADTNDLGLSAIAALTVSNINGTNYLFAGGEGDKTISIFAIEADGTLRNTDSVVDFGFGLIDRAADFQVVEISGTHYLFAVGVTGNDALYEGRDGRISAFEITADGKFVSHGTFDDDTNLLINGRQAITSVQQGGNDFVYGSGYWDSGISIFQATTQPLLYTAGQGDRVFDGANFYLGGDVLHISNAGGSSSETFTLQPASTPGELEVAVFSGGTAQIRNINEFDFTFGDFGDRLTITGDLAEAIAGPLSMATQISVTGGTGADVINAAGLAGPDGLVVNAGDGNDQITGSIYADTISGEGHNDRIFGLGGNDTLVGGDANDVLLGGAGNDILNGDSGTDFLVSGAGSDTLTAGSGRDRLRGGDGADSLSGGEGDDVLFGEAGNDTLAGDVGRDLLFGGAGNDTFIFNDVMDSGLNYTDRDIIRDFIQSVDIIDVSAIDANINTMADDAFTFVGNSGFTGTAGELFAFVSAGGQTVVWADIDGDMTRDMTFVIDGVFTLTGADFLL